MNATQFVISAIILILTIILCKNVKNVVNIVKNATMIYVFSVKAITIKYYNKNINVNHVIHNAKHA